MNYTSLENQALYTGTYNKLIVSHKYACVYKYNHIPVPMISYISSAKRSIQVFLVL